jgi:hypothetical protein
VFLFFISVKLPPPTNADVGTQIRNGFQSVAKNLGGTQSGISSSSATIKQKKKETTLTLQTREQHIADFLSKRTIVYVAPGLLMETNRSWSFAIQHMGDTKPAMNVQIAAYTEEEGPLNPHVVASGININPEPGYIHILQPFSWTPNPSSGDTHHLFFTIDDFDGRVTQEFILVNKPNHELGVASRVIDQKSSTVLLVCKDEWITDILDGSWSKFDMPDCGAMFRKAALLREDISARWELLRLSDEGLICVNGP